MDSAFLGEEEEEEEEERRANLLKLADEIIQSHDMAFVDMLRCGLLAIQMLPENSSSGECHHTFPLVTVLMGLHVMQESVCLLSQQALVTNAGVRI